LAGFFIAVAIRLLPGTRRQGGRPQPRRDGDLFCGSREHFKQESVHICSSLHAFLFMPVQEFASSCHACEDVVRQPARGKRSGGRAAKAFPAFRVEAPALHSG
jgi:hypothetical protein